MISVNSTSNLYSTVGDPFQSFNWTIANQPTITSPRDDEVGQGLASLPLLVVLDQNKYFLNPIFCYLRSFIGLLAKWTVSLTYFCCSLQIQCDILQFLGETPERRLRLIP